MPFRGAVAQFGRAPRSQCGGQGFDPPLLHQLTFAFPNNYSSQPNHPSFLVDATSTFSYYSGRGLRKADDIPEFLLELRARAASFANLNAEAFQHVLVTEYGPGAGIGWHRDKAVFGEVVGISLLAPCVLRFRRKLNGSRGNERVPSKQPVNVKGNPETVKSKVKLEGVNPRANWERVNVNVEPRSAYHLSGPARSEWYHSILRVDALRYAITFRIVNAESVR